MKKIKGFLPSASLIIWDIISVAISVTLAITQTFWSFYQVPPYYEHNRLLFIVALSAVVIVANTICGCYNRVLRAIGFSDIIHQGVSVLITMGVVVIGDAAARHIYMLRNPDASDSTGFLPPTAYLIIGMSLIILSVVGRGCGRFFDVLKETSLKSKTADPVIIYGAGETGTYLLKKINGHSETDMRVVAFIDDDVSLHGRKIERVKIIGGKEKLDETIVKYGVKQVIIAIPTAERETILDILDVCKKHHCRTRRFGTIEESDSEPKNMVMREINLEQLLHRDSVSLNMEVVENFIKNRVVLVTGGAGSIGSEICRQVLRFGCKQLVVVDFNENGLFFVDNEFKEKYAGKFVVRLGSIRERERMTEIFDEFNPEIVFHAAAHKHVPMMEINPREAIKNNVMGTINVCQVAVMHKVRKFITISTDKAVNPTNIMGASKRITELVMQMMDTVSDTDFAAVRFGNVLGSNGSVVPFFRDQIAKGGPVTVTHPDMRRYFMTIPEACQLVLEAGAMAKGGEIFVLDMGQPVLISDLAKDMIRLSGFEPDKDIKIIYTGLRPGEKLFEEISLADEDVDHTTNKKIMIMKPMPFDDFKLAATIKDLEAAVRDEDISHMFGLVKKLVPTFDHKS